MRELRLITYLSPGIPEEFFELVCGVIARSTGLRVGLESETRASGPIAEGGADPFLNGAADLAWMCAPAYLTLRDRGKPKVELIRAAPVFQDPRNNGRPLYFSEVVVRKDATAAEFADLRGARWVYNDRSSMSGYFNLLKKLSALGEGPDFFHSLRCSGSHGDSLCSVAVGRADAAALDSNVLRLAMATRDSPAHRLRVIETWGPYPVQPLVVRSELDPDVKERIAAALTEAHQDSSQARKFARYGARRFVSVGEEDYREERESLRTCDRLDSELVGRPGVAVSPLPPPGSDPGRGGKASRRSESRRGK